MVHWLPQTAIPSNTSATSFLHLKIKFVTHLFCKLILIWGFSCSLSDFINWLFTKLVEGIWKKIHPFLLILVFSTNMWRQWNILCFLYCLESIRCCTVYTSVAKVNIRVEVERDTQGQVWSSPMTLSRVSDSEWQTNLLGSRVGHKRATWGLWDLNMSMACYTCEAWPPWLSTLSKRITKAKFEFWLNNWKEINYQVFWLKKLGGHKAVLILRKPYDKSVSVMQDTTSIAQYLQRFTVISYD